VLDLFLVVAFLLLMVRGWFRGFVREAMDLAGLIVGTLLAFRFSGPVGAVIESMANIAPDTARIVGGIIVFVLVGIGAAVGTSVLERHARLPGLNLPNRVAGAGLALAWGIFLATMILSLAVILPTPPAVASHLGGSAVTGALTDPDGVPQEVFKRLSGDRAVEALLNLRELVGERRVILEDDQSIQFPPIEGSDLDLVAESADEVFDLLNRARVDEGLDPLAWSPGLAKVGEHHAADMYTSGYFAHRSPTTGTVADRLEVDHITYLVAGENLALAATPDEVHRGLMDSPGHRANIMGTDYRRVGIAAIRGPLGLMVVQVFTG